MNHPVAAIEVNNLSKCYKIYAKPLDLALDVLNLKKNYKEHWALQDINFSVQKGEVVGVLGVNGSGKSTLLKILSGKLEKSAGNYQVNGQVSSILELGTGFHPHYSGRENILMGSMCTGLSKEEALKKMDWIIEFSGLKDVIDQPFNTYSSGMQARLTFATAVSIDPDIFIVDEALATGDAFFAQKCLNRIRQICKTGTTALFVSHSSHAIVQLCSRAIWLDEGKVRMDGPAVDVVREYEYFGHQKNSASISNAMVPENLQPEVLLERIEQEGDEVDTTTRTILRRGPYCIKDIRFLNANGAATMSLRVGEKLTIEVDYEIPEDLSIDGQSLDTPYTNVGLAVSFLRKMDLLRVVNFSTAFFKDDQESLNYAKAEFRKNNCKSGTITADMSPFQIAPGEYFVSIGLLKNDPVDLHFYELRYLYYDFEVMREGVPNGGIFYPMVNWQHTQNETLQGIQVAMDAQMHNLTETIE
jgi:ABC-type polysaccharide/polyol phosphate transport system ATPase subunit